MKQILITIAAICALMSTAIFAFGDIARPQPTPVQGKSVFYTGLTIMTDKQGTEARLQIPEDALKEIQKAAGRTDSSESITQRIMHSSTRTIMAGLFMFLAVSFAGVWFARSGQRREQKVIAAVLLIAVLFGVGTMIVRANAGPPGYIRWQNLPQSLKDGKPTSGGLSIEIVPGDDSMKLILPLRTAKAQGE